MTFVFHVLGSQQPQAYDDNKIYTEYAVFINSSDMAEAKGRFAAWQLLLNARGDLEHKSHHIYCTAKCRCSKKIKRGKRILSHAIRQVQYPIYTPSQWPAIDRPWPGCPRAVDSSAGL